MRRRAYAMAAALGLSGALEVQAASNAYSQAVLSGSPAVYYRFDESSGDTLNHGSLGSGFDAMVTVGVTRLVASPDGDFAVGFDNAGDQIASNTQAPAAFTGNPAFTIEAVFKVDNFAQFWAPLLHWGSGLSGKEVYFSFQNGNEDRLYAGFYNAGLRTENIIPQSTWLHAIWVRQGGTNSVTGSVLYLNGVAVLLQLDTDLTANGITPDVTSTPFQINHASDFTRYFVGAIDELALYDNAISPARALAHYRAFAGLLPGDTDGDGDIDDADLGAAFASYTGPLGPAGGKTWAQGDTDGDGDVDDADLGTAFASYTGPLGPAVPEPTTLALLVTGGVLIVRRKRRRA